MLKCLGNIICDNIICDQYFIALFYCLIFINKYKNVIARQKATQATVTHVRHSKFYSFKYIIYTRYI